MSSQMAAVQVSPRPQSLPQVPQWAAVVRRSASQPSASTMLQSPKLVLQASVHAVAPHDGVEFGRATQLASAPASLVTPSQSSSSALQISVAPGLTAAFESAQSPP